VFGLFFALLIVCALRGLSLHVWAFSKRLQSASGGLVAPITPLTAVGKAQ